MPNASESEINEETDRRVKRKLEDYNRGEDKRCKDEKRPVKEEIEEPVGRANRQRIAIDLPAGAHRLVENTGSLFRDSTARTIRI